MSNFLKKNPVKDFITENKESVVFLPIEEIQTREIFENLLPINDEVSEIIYQSMLQRGFDRNKPVIIWEQENVLVDGYTRLKNAKRAIEKGADIVAIPALKKPFESEEEVIDFMLKEQFGRRNIKSDNEILPLAQKLVSFYQKSYGKGDKAAYLSNKIPELTEGKAKKLISVLNNASDEQLQSIINEKSSINAVYEMIKSPAQNGSSEPNSAAQGTSSPEAAADAPEDEQPTPPKSTRKPAEQKQPKATVYMDGKDMHMTIDGNSSILLTFKGPLLVVPQESCDKLKERIIDAVQKVVESAFGTKNEL